MLQLDEVICHRIAQTLATAPIHDHLGYEALAYLKLPGPNYLQLLASLHRALKPALYVEIGVRRGDSLAQVLPDTRIIGIDPNMSVPHDRLRTNMVLASATSEEFFKIDVNRENCRGFDLAFIDGSHDFKDAAFDFATLESLAKPSSVIAIHDVIPMDARTSQPSSKGVSFHTGDVWRLMDAIVAERKDLIAFTVATPPTGLGIVGRFAGDLIYCADWLMPIALGNGDWIPQCPSDWAEQVRMLNIVPNDAKSIIGALLAR